MIPAPRSSTSLALLLTFASGAWFGLHATPPASPARGCDERRGPASVHSAEVSPDRRAWLSLLQQDLPRNTEALHEFYDAYVHSCAEQLHPELYFVDVWDVLRRFGWPSELDRYGDETHTGFSWDMTYRDLDIVRRDEDGEVLRVDALHLAFHGEDLLEVLADEEE